MSRFSDTYPGALISIRTDRLIPVIFSHRFHNIRTCVWVSGNISRKHGIYPASQTCVWASEIMSEFFVSILSDNHDLCTSVGSSIQETDKQLPFLHFRQNDHVMYLSGMSCIWTTTYVSVTFYYCCLYVLTCIAQSCHLSRHTVLYITFYKFVRSFIGESCCLS